MVCPVEVGFGFVGKFSFPLLIELGIKGQSLEQTLKNMTDRLTSSIEWLWI